MNLKSQCDHLLSKRGIRRWWVEVGIPIYIPEEGRAALLREEIGGPNALLMQLERLAALGSTWASSALGCILVYPDANGNRDVEKAKGLVMQGASAGDAYSQYILAWAELFSGNMKSSFDLLKRSAQGGFSPALLDLGAVLDSREPGKSIASSLKMLKRAESLNHLAARGRIFELWKSGRMGWYRKVPGYVGSLVSGIRLSMKVRRDPIAEQVFCIHDQFLSPPIRRLAQSSANSPKL
jgi:hypothetical protein